MNYDFFEVIDFDENCWKHVVVIFIIDMGWSDYLENLT